MRKLSYLLITLFFTSIFYSTGFGAMCENAKSYDQCIATLKTNFNPSKDTLSFKQYYLQTLNITGAWKTIDTWSETRGNNTNQVIVAVIDDGLDTSQADLKDIIWIDPKGGYGQSTVKDFVGDNIANLPAGDHGTKVAGIIGAKANNDLGIAGIARNIKIMPLRVFPLSSTGGAKNENIISAINYAIDNNANIINLSLGDNQFAIYSTNFDAVIKKAYDKGVVIVIAAGNGNILYNGIKGLDLSVTPISPVCNNSANHKMSIGVGSIDRIGYKSLWSNYGNCVSFYAPGEGILSTSVPFFNDGYGYATGDGTSFSAPIVSGVIALGYNRYGKVPPDIVYDSLVESLSIFPYMEDDGGLRMPLSDRTKVIDANTYLTILGQKLPEIEKRNKEITSSTTTVVTNTQTPANTNTQTGAIKNSNLTNGETLATAGIIKKQNTENEYRYDDFVLRQEVVIMASRLGGVNVTNGYVCKNYYKDLTLSKPNDWACGAIEVAADNGIVSRDNTFFRPEDKISKAEALVMLLRASKINIATTSVTDYLDVTVPWQINTTSTAKAKGIIDSGTYFLPNQNATRGEMFEMAKRILNIK